MPAPCQHQIRYPAGSRCLEVQWAGRVQGAGEKKQPSPLEMEACDRRGRLLPALACQLSPSCTTTFTRTP